MIITCPHCDTHFSVSEAALGTKGRTVRCARCSHKWHQDPRDDSTNSEIPLEMQPVAPSRAGRPRETLAENLFPAGAQDDAAGESLPMGVPVDFGSMPAESPAEGDEKEAEEDDPFAKISELMMSSTPEPIPDVFASVPPKPAPRRKGAAGLWLLLVVLLSGSAGAGLYFLQDKVIDHWPEVARYYDEFGLRNEVVGAGLTFRNYNSERLVQDSNEVLIVRGVIANTTEQPHEVPLLRLALYNNQTLLQEKIISPPQTTLDAHGTVGFRITLDQPDANASRFEVTFTAAKPPAKDSAPAQDTGPTKDPAPAK
jgi:predicted Zn finger-like uncharacterized protein